jgi:hypothetical protein
MSRGGGFSGIVIKIENDEPEDMVGVGANGTGIETQWRARRFTAGQREQEGTIIMMTNHNSLARLTGRAVKVLALTALPAALLIQSAVAQNRAAAKQGDENASSDTDTHPYDKHDFTGLWSRNPGQFKMPACPECRDRGPAPGYGFFGDVPPRTPEGEKKMSLNHPSRGWELKDAAKHMSVDEGMRRAVIPEKGNDPENRCNPLGLARNIAFSGGGASMEMISLKDRIIQRFEWTWDNRTIWMDGRKIPDVDDYLPRFNGYSVGKWEGDTLVVTSTGFDDRQWVDQFGYPISDKAVLTERWSRPSPNRLQVDMTLTDPVIYTRPWQSSRKVWALIPKDKMEIGGWSGILEDRCVPDDESLFHEVSNAAGGKRDK